MSLVEMLKECVVAGLKLHIQKFTFSYVENFGISSNYHKVIDHNIQYCFATNLIYIFLVILKSVF